MSVSMQRDIGAYLVGKNVLNPRVITAGTTADGLEITGYDIGLSTGFTNKPHSVKVVIPYSASLSAAETVTFTGNFQQGATTAAFADSAGSTFSVTIGSTASTAAQTLNDAFSRDLTLKGDWDYVRFQVTPSISSTVTDTLDIGGVAVFGGFDVTPGA